MKDGSNMSQEQASNDAQPALLDDVTVIIQGRTDPECIAHYASKYAANCIVSTWEGDEVDPLGMRIVRSLKPSDPGHQHSHFQIVSTLAGLRACETRWVIKVRGDEYFSNLEYVVEELKNTDKILTLPIFFRNHATYPFHPSDHLIAGTKRQMVMMYRSALRKRALKNWPWRVIPEQLLGSSYLEAAEGKRKLTKDHMLKHFDILNLDRMKNYRVSWNGGGKRFYNDFEQGVDGIPGITSMKDL